MMPHHESEPELKGAFTGNSLTMRLLKSFSTFRFQKAYKIIHLFPFSHWRAIKTGTMWEKGHIDTWQSGYLCFYTMHHARQGSARCHTLLIGLKGNQQVLLHQSYLAARPHAIRDYSTKGSMLSDNSKVGFLMFLGFATRVIGCFSMFNANDNAQDKGQWSSLEQITRHLASRIGAKERFVGPLPTGWTQSQSPHTFITNFVGHVYWWKVPLATGWMSNKLWDMESKHCILLYSRILIRVFSQINSCKIVSDNKVNYN